MSYRSRAFLFIRSTFTLSTLVNAKVHRCWHFIDTKSKTLRRTWRRRSATMALDKGTACRRASSFKSGFFFFFFHSLEQPHINGICPDVRFNRAAAQQLHFPFCLALSHCCYGFSLDLSWKYTAVSASVKYLFFLLCLFISISQCILIFFFLFSFFIWMPIVFSTFTHLKIFWLSWSNGVHKCVPNNPPPPHTQWITTAPRDLNKKMNNTQLEQRSSGFSPPCATSQCSAVHIYDRLFHTLRLPLHSNTLRWCHPGSTAGDLMRCHTNVSC